MAPAAGGSQGGGKEGDDDDIDDRLGHDDYHDIDGLRHSRPIACISGRAQQFRQLHIVGLVVVSSYIIIVVVERDGRVDDPCRQRPLLTAFVLTIGVPGYWDLIL